jgi:hypothetical protein
MTEDQIKAILNRLADLYRDIPLEYCGLVLTAIEDIEEIIYRENGNP